MADILVFSAALILGFLLGSIPWAFLCARIAGVDDIRRHGSSNMGTMNAFRVAGKLPGLMTLVLDVGKGVLAVFLGQLLVGTVMGGLLGALGAVVGHIFPLYLGFKGGKAIAVYAGAMLILSLPTLLFWGLAWILIWLMIKRVALASALAFLITPLFMLAWGYSLPFILFGVFTSLLIAYRHYGDIRSYQ